MTKSSIESEEEEIPILAVEALSAANRLTLQAGATVVLVRDGKLIRIEPTGETILRTLSEKPKVLERTRQIRLVKRSV